MSEEEHEAYFTLVPGLADADKARLHHRGEIRLAKYQRLFPNYQYALQIVKTMKLLADEHDPIRMRTTLMVQKSFKDARDTYMEIMQQVKDNPRSVRLVEEMIAEADSYLIKIDKYSEPWKGVTDKRRFK